MAQNFAASFAEALPAGVALSREWENQRNARSARKAGEILSQLQSYDPFMGQHDPTAQGLPEEGQTTAANPNQGFDGADFDRLSDEYFKAIANIGDIREQGTAQALYGQFRMNKINDYVDQALLAYDQGDMNGASRGLRGASAFMSPGTTPEITVDPNSGAFIVANYENGKPSGGYAITRDQLMDIRGRNTDFNAWANRDQDKQQFREQMSLRYAQAAASQRNASARLALARTSADAKAEYDAVKLAGAKLDNALTQSNLDLKNLELDKTRATQESGIAATLAENAAKTATNQGIEEAAPYVTEQNIAQAKENTRVADQKAEQDYMKTLFGDEGGHGGLFEDSLSYPISDSTPSPPGGAFGAPGSAIPTDGSQDTGNMSIADQFLQQGMAVTGKSGGGKTALDPMFYDVGADGVATRREGVFSLANQTAHDIWGMNGGEEGDVVPEAVNSVIVGALGRSQTTQLQADPADPQVEGDERYYLSDGVSHFEISKPTYDLIYNYQEDFKQEFARLQGRPIPISNRPPAGVMEENPNEAEMGAIPESLPGGGGPGMTPPPGPQIPNSPGLQSVGMSPTAGPAPAQLGGGYNQTPVTTPRQYTDDTASGVQSPPRILANAPTVTNVPGLAEAVLAWDATGRENRGPTMARVMEILNSLPPDVRERASQEIVTSGQ